MIGNDIIDLGLAKEVSGLRQSRLYHKLFTPEEQQALKKAEDRNLLFWKFWAMKEAAYKAHQRRFRLARSFEPTKFECTSSVGEELVKIGEHTYSLHTSRTAKHLQSVAVAFPAEKFQHETSVTSEETKEKLFAAVSAWKKIPQEKISLEKDKDSVPHLMYQNRNLNCAFSLSHHGNFSAYVLSLTNC
ncbi:MAG: 4'-phosphopantetheinyl transferase superfamily protein [Salegentibacter sp.]